MFSMNMRTHNGNWLVCLTFLTLVSFLSAGSSECGRSPFNPYIRARIVGGRKADERSWPWAVKIFVEGKQVCGGTLINKEFVLTAAHCLENIDRYYPPVPQVLNEDRKHKAKDVQVKFQGKNGTTHTSIELHIHQNYNPAKIINDIALIQIPKIKRFAQTQRAICLPRQVNTTKLTKHGNSMYAVGWGFITPFRISKRDVPSKYLKQVRLPFKPDKMCADNVKSKTEKGHNNMYFNSTTQFCAGDITGKNDTCTGDSGGPAMVFYKHPVSGNWRWFQVGITSWGYGCAQVGEVGYYTKVSAYINWIDGN